jgi:ribosomal protein S18 acetylase RimI-like enzyme
MLQTRAATAADAALLASHRQAMFAAIGGIDQSVLDAVRNASEPWTARMIGEGKYLGWITSEDGRPIASAGMLILDWPPHPFDPSGESRAYLLNVFVEPEYRRRGLARELVALCMAEARRRRIRVVSLHASREGRPLYESLGFRATNEMLSVDPVKTPPSQS